MADAFKCDMCGSLEEGIPIKSNSHIKTKEDKKYICTASFRIGTTGVRGNNDAELCIDCKRVLVKELLDSLTNKNDVSEV